MLSRLAFRLTLVILANSVLGGSLAAQSFDLAGHGRQIVALDGLMRFRPGDDPTLAWANPSFDDDSWPLIRGNQTWYAQGYPHLTGFAWYRFKVTLPTHPGPLALWVPGIATNFQIFANGRLIAELGSMPPHPSPFSGENLAFPIPADLTQTGEPLTFAIRVWHYPSEFGGGQVGGFQESMQLGDASLIQEWQTHRLRQIFWEDTQYNIYGLVCLLAGVGSLLLFFLRPTDREFLWFGLFEVLNVAYVIWQAYCELHSTSIIFWLWGQAILILGLNTSLPTMIRHFGRIGRTRLYWVAIAAALSDFLLNSVVALNWISTSLSGEVGAFSKFLLAASNCGLLFQASKDSKVEMRIFSAPIAVYFLNLTAVYVTAVLIGQGATRMIHYQSLFFNGLTNWPFPFGTYQITGIAVQLALFSIFLLRFVRTRADEERYKNELEAARAVQEVLVPNEIPSVPGFAVESIYKPAGQVGGDFFQIIRISNDGVLVAIGDVSGKGMPAAMTVSLLVGTLRTLVHYTQSPSEILAAMNHRMLARSPGGFTTCLVLTVSAAGTLTAANAGHIAPYVNGRELALNNGLPLGLSALEQYAESVFPLAAGEQLTLMTDGVVEAHAKNGELLGFERVKAMLPQSADSIVRAAQQFGQDDDITVLTLRLAPA
ncbi:MAG: PP2C family protein-serine/threonine phosphatase [Acidobacteriaceae bacterium]|jgi:sigma-B regulation protein RsbU (phosphoserine phosphatase)